MRSRFATAWKRFPEWSEVKTTTGRPSSHQRNGSNHKYSKKTTRGIFADTSGCFKNDFTMFSHELWGTHVRKKWCWSDW